MINQGFFPGGTGGSPHPAKILPIPPSDTCPRFWTKACPPPAEVRPWKFEKFKYIFVSNLNTVKLKSTLKNYRAKRIGKKSEWYHFDLVVCSLIS